MAAQARKTEVFLGVAAAMLLAAAPAGAGTVPARTAAHVRTDARQITRQAAPRFANCTTMHKKYRGGISKLGAGDKRPHGGHARYKPYLNNAFYAANKSLDRDKDGIACEQ